MLNIKKESGIWTLEIREKFGFYTEDTLEEVFKVLLDYKKQHGNLNQMKEDEGKEKRKDYVLDYARKVENIAKTIKEDLEGKEDGKTGL